MYLESYAFNRFSIGYGLVGAAEVRLILLALNTVFALGAEPRFSAFGISLTVFDVAGLAIVGGMAVLPLGRAARSLALLRREEPGAPRR